METVSQVAEQFTLWRNSLQIDNEQLNELVIKAIGRLMRAVAGREFNGKIQPLIDAYYLNNQTLRLSPPSEKTLQLLGRGDYSRKHKQPQKFSHLSPEMFLRVLEPLGISTDSFFARYLFDCPINQARVQLPADYVPRQSLLDALVAQLTGKSGRAGNALWLTSTLVGSGGVGKSVLAAAAGVDPRVTRQFYDAVIWFEVGNTPPEEINAKAASLASYLAGQWQGAGVSSRPRETGEWDPSAHRKSGILKLAQVIGTRHVLLIADDVWEETPVTWINEALRGCPNAAALFTSRISRLVGSKGREISVDYMSREEARQLVGENLPLSMAANLDVERLLDITGRWPLLIKLAKGLIQLEAEAGSQDPDRELNCYDLALAKVIDKLTADGVVEITDVAHTQEARHTNLGVVIHHSMERLKTQPGIAAILHSGQAFGFCIQDHFGGAQNFRDVDGLFHSLALFPEDSHIYVDSVAPLWNMSPGHVKQIFRQLHKYSLLDFLQEEGEDCYIRLHDEISRYLNEKFKGYEAQLHARWLDAMSARYHFSHYLEQCLAKQTFTKHMPVYFWRQHGFHLLKANRADELLGWLKNPAYLMVRSFALNSTYALETDIHSCMMAAIEQQQIPVSEFLDELKCHLPHLSDMVSSVTFKDWIANFKAHIQVLLPGAHDIKTCWNVCHGWEKSLLPPKNLIRSLVQHYDRVIDVLPFKGDYLVTCGDDRSVRTYRESSGELLFLTVLKKEEHPTCLLNVGDSYYLCATDQGRVYYRDLSSDEHRFTLELPDREPVSSCCVSDEGYLAVLQNNGVATLWPLFSQELIASLDTLVPHVRCCLFDDNNHLILASEDGFLYTIAPETCKVVKKAPGLAAPAMLEYIQPYLLLSSEEGAMAVWDWQQQKRLYQLSECFGRAGSCLLPGGKVFYFTGEEKICILDLGSGKREIFNNAYGYDGEAPVFWHDELVVFASTFDTLVAFDYCSGEVRHHFNPHSCPISCLRIIHGQLFCGTDMGFMSTWRPQASPLQDFEPPLDQCFVQADNLLLTASHHGGKITRWHTDGSEQELAGPDYEGEPLGLDSVLLFEDGIVLSILPQNRLVLWHAISNDIISDVVADVEITQSDDIHMLDKYRICVLMEDSRLAVIDCTNGKPVAEHSGHSQSVNAVKQLKSGRVMSFGWDNSIQLWQDEKYPEILALQGHECAVMDAIELADGSLLSVSNDTRVKRWNSETGELLETVQAEEVEQENAAGLGACAELENGLIAISTFDRRILFYDRSWQLKSTVKLHSDISCLHAVGENKLVIGLKNGRLVMLSLGG